MDEPWLTILGLGEDGPAGLSPRSQAALDAAQIIMGPPRHLALVPETGAERITWPVPFADGIDILKGLAGQRVVVLASGDPFWFGAGSVIARHFPRDDWTALPGPSAFAMTAAEMGWPLERTACLGLHAAPYETLRPHLAPGARLIVTLRDGPAAHALADYLTEQGWGASALTLLEGLGGPDQRMTHATADTLTGAVEHPVTAAIAVAGDGRALSCASGQPDDAFNHDGQITKRPVRAITLSTLAPKPGEHLWDIGAGSGSIALEWLLSHPTTTATCFEPRADRAANITVNAGALGLAARLTLVQGAAPDALAEQGPPDAVFVGGGLTEPLLQMLLDLPARLVANVVTLEGEALLTTAHARHGGTLMRIALSEAAPLGAKRGWSSAYPVVQWSLTR